MHSLTPPISILKLESYTWSAYGRRSIYAIDQKSWNYKPIMKNNKITQPENLLETLFSSQPFFELKMRSLFLFTILLSNIILNSDGQTLRGSRMAQESDTSPASVAEKVAGQVDVDAVRSNVTSAVEDVNVTEVVGIVKDINATEVVGNITDVVDAVKDINATEVVGNVTEAVEDAVDTIKDLDSNEVLDAVSENIDVELVQETVGSAVENVAENVAENVDVDKVTEIAGSVATGLSESDLTGTVQGIRDGDLSPEEAAEEAAEAAAEAAQSVASNVAENIDVESVTATATEAIGAATEEGREFIGNVAENADVDGADVMNTADCILDCGSSCEADGGSAFKIFRCTQTCITEGCAP